MDVEKKGLCGEVIKEEIRQGIHPFMKELFYRIAEGGDGLQMDGVWVYNENAQFIGGKVINFCGYVVTELMEGREREEGLKALAQIIERSAALPMETWGILNAVTGLYRLEQKGVREQAAAPELWEELKARLDWRTFVDCKNHLALIQLPTNYYGVAYGIARYRELLGWDEEGYSRQLLNRFLEHIKAYSGDYGFMDETQGQGRFDRYSILVPAEIANTVWNTGIEGALPDQIAFMLRKSAEICLSLANSKGQGFAYGRSTGAYGDTGVMEVLWAAARGDGILSTGEKMTAYRYCAAIVRRFREFWIDGEMESVNLWEKGRRTDSYRNKNRILSETLSLCMQVAALYGWERPEGAASWPEEDGKGTTGQVAVFARGEYDRALAVVRSRGHVFQLPVICGGDSYYRASPYLPIPYEPFFITGVPEEAYADLVPQLILESGQAVMPVAYMKDLAWHQGEGDFFIRWRQDEQCVVNGGGMEPFSGIVSETEYCFRDGEIERTDTFYIKGSVSVTGARMEFLTFSEEPQEEQGRIRFARGGLRQVSAEGFEGWKVEVLDGKAPSCKTPEGRLNCRIEWTKELERTEENRERVLRFSWKIRYGELAD